jgi:tRNA(Arg) A34 adenosine deaminase TadA
MTLAPISQVVIRLPDWIPRELDLSRTYASDDDKMALVVELAERNIRHGGGPFGAAVLDQNGALLAVGANWVVSQHSSLLHAEVSAILFAQARLGTHRLGLSYHELVASSEPCAQCLGATVWSGVRRLVCGAPASAAEAIGFDEGPRPADWVDQLEHRGIAVTTGVLAGRARSVLDAYAANGGAIYNGVSA